MSITERIDAITKIPLERLQSAVPAPKSVKIELTARCNYLCSFCALRTRESKAKGDIDFKLFKKITQEMKEAGVEEIGLFFLGESFISPDILIGAIEWCKQEMEFPYVFLTTNGSLANKQVVFEAMDAGLDSLKWSVNAADEEQFEKIMGVKKSLFWTSLTNLREARYVRDSNQFKCTLSASSIQYDGEQGLKMEALIKDHVAPWVDQHYWLPLYGQMTHWNEDREADLGYKPTAGNQGRIGALRDPLPCWTCFTEGHVTAEGLLTACCFDSDGRFKMGDLKTENFMDAWNSIKFQELRQCHLNKDVKGTICEGCLAYENMD